MNKKQRHSDDFTLEMSVIYNWEKSASFDRKTNSGIEKKIKQKT
jgi:hypothetical protein